MGEATKDFRKEMREREKIRKKAELGLYLNTNFVFSNQWCQDFIISATRGVGKTVIALETAKILKDKYGEENVKCYWFRLKDDSIKALLANHAEKAVDPYLVKKYNMEITCKNNIVYDHGKPLFEAYALVSAGSKGKGVNLYDCNWFGQTDENGKLIKRFVVTVWDEFILAEGVEKKSIGNPVDQYTIFREAIFRDAEQMNYQCAFNFLLANNVGECAPITGAMYNYIPHPTEHRRVALKRKRAMFWNVPITDAYIEKRKKSLNSNIIDFDDDSNYAEIKRDLSLVKPKSRRLVKVTALYKFGDRKNQWFCEYDGKFIRKYRGETVNKDIIFPMKRYIDATIFNASVVKEVIERYDCRGFLYADLMSMALFKSFLKEIKSK